MLIAIDMKKLLLIIIIINSMLFRSEASDEAGHNRVAFSGTLTSSDTYSIEASYHYMFCRYFGVGGAFGHWANYFDDGWASGSNWNIDDDDNKPSNLYLKPSVVLKTPALTCRASSWSLFAEPGVMLNVPYQRVCIESTPNWHAIEYDYVSTNKGQWLAFDLRVGVDLQIGPGGLSAGYIMSNLNIYSQYRHLSYKGVSFRDFYPNKPFMQGAFLSLYYIF